MNDHLGLFGREEETGELDLNDLRAALSKTASATTPDPVRVLPRREIRAARQAAARRRKRRIRQTTLAIVVLALLVGGVVVGFKLWRKDSTAVADFVGNGTTDVVVRVQSGDSLTDIAQTLTEDGVVASSAAFINAASDNSDIKSIKVGYYKVKLHASAEAAVDAISDSNAQVGQLRIIPGLRLEDTKNKAGEAVPGYISLITKAACVPLNGVANCFNADQLWKVAETSDPTALGVPSWAVAGIRAAPDPKRRLEGMLVPGDYDIAPGTDPVAVLHDVVSQSATNWDQTDIVAGSKLLGRDPYQVLTVASVAQREGTNSIYGKVSRVVYNRLAINMKLQMDSTVSYALGLSTVATTSRQRATATPYNTYLNTGLPPTPITSPGTNALDAALNPDDGKWLYFVQVDRQGDFCFSVTGEEHNKCVEQARAAGVFDE
ncbi:UPF0755 protein [Nakamurella panacisegetis]|uniref:Endolytic murein transglycosylase n=1 Tax=Nakamurella panacisegetis TaxID=1090615 RepID=A0A1H0QXW5_9ACTN|nr:endolytic transglycosylase MltG [Nakamurella panacisegetis]SDP22131.1 UPF0755 protein [Nakamurella panacisegetis]